MPLLFSSHCIYGNVVCDTCYSVPGTEDRLPLSPILSHLAIMKTFTRHNYFKESHRFPLFEEPTVFALVNSRFNSNLVIIFSHFHQKELIINFVLSLWRFPNTFLIYMQSAAIDITAQKDSSFPLSIFLFHFWCSVFSLEREGKGRFQILKYEKLYSIINRIQISWRMPQQVQLSKIFTAKKVRTLKFIYLQHSLKKVFLSVTLCQ